MRQSKPSSRHPFTIRNERHVLQGSTSVMLSNVKITGVEVMTLKKTTTLLSL